VLISVAGEHPDTRRRRTRALAGSFGAPARGGKVQAGKDESGHLVGRPPCGVHDVMSTGAVRGSPRRDDLGDLLGPADRQVGPGARPSRRRQRCAATSAATVAGQPDGRPRPGRMRSRLAGRRTTPPPVAMTCRARPHSSASRAASRSRKPASPSRAKTSQIEQPGACLEQASASTSPSRAGAPAGRHRWTCPLPRGPTRKRRDCGDKVTR